MNPSIYEPYWFDETVQAAIQNRYALWSLMLGIVTLMVAGVVAWRQFLIMNAQTEMMKEQTAISKRQEQTSDKQAQIAATQHEIMLEQLAKKGLLAVEAGTSHKAIFNGREWTEVELLAVNKGTGTVRGFHWEIQVQHMPPEVMTWETLDGDPMQPHNMVPGTGRWSLSEDTSQQVFPKRRIPFIRLRYNHNHMAGKTIRLKTILVGEDGEWRQNVEIDVNSTTATYSHDVFT